MSTPLETFINQIQDKIPESLKAAPNGVKQTLNALLEDHLRSMDLVGREEFDIQCEVLAKTRKKVEQLEKEVSDLQQLLNETQRHAKQSSSDEA